MKRVIDSIEFEDFSALSKTLKTCVFNPFINYILPASLLKKVLRESKSNLMHESLRLPGSWQSMQICYDNPPAKDLIDHLVLRLGSFPVALRNRKKLMVKTIAEHIHAHKHNERVVLVGIGSGNAINAMHGIKHAGVEHVEGYFIDRESDAHTPGKHIAQSLKLHDKVKFIQGEAVDIHKFIPKKAHIFKLIGILEYLSDNDVKKILQVGHKNLAAGGTVITHSIEPAHGIDPFLKRVFGLKLNYRSPWHIRQLLEESGFLIQDVKPEPLQVYHAVTAIKK
ncbi:hypothetical protein KDK77_01945 [bacterium]|nr:hypothetical protein [bacterium]